MIALTKWVQVSSPAALAEALSHATEAEYVRFTADWLTDADDLDSEPPATGNRLIDAIVSAAAAHANFTSCGEVPAWTPISLAETRHGCGG